MRYLLCCVFCLCALSAVAQATPEGAGPLPGDIAEFARPQSFRDHLIYLGEYPSEGAAGKIREFTVRLDPQEPSIDPGYLPFGEVVNFAAQFYAVYNNKYTFTVGDMINDGWLPFILPEWQQHSADYIANSDATPLLKDHWEITPYARSPQWVMSQKNRLATLFYSQCNWTSGQTAGNYPKPPRMDQMPPANPAFWVNPFTGDAANVGTRAGDLKEWDYTRGYSEHTRPLLPEWLKSIRTFNWMDQS